MNVDVNVNAYMSRKEVMVMNAVFTEETTRIGGVNAK
jgi:hypothetical protein